MEEEKEILGLDYTKYFDEYFPINRDEVKKNGFKHIYSVKVHRALFTPESFKVFQIYEKSIHDKLDKNEDNYGNFLCYSPLFDPR